MKGSIAGLFVVASLVATGHVCAQEIAPTPGRLEVSLIPGGGTWLLDKDDSPGFGNYDAGAAAAYNFSRIFGVEGEVAGAFGLEQELNSVFGERTSPNLLSYTGNLVANWTGRSFVPYATGGIGALSVFEREDVGITGTETHFTGNVGGGVKWFAPSARWGIRGDYRFLMTRGKDSATAFLGTESRYGHRVYGAVVINAIR
jgi:hypothetical protein